MLNYVFVNYYSGKEFDVRYGYYKNSRIKFHDVRNLNEAISVAQKLASSFGLTVSVFRNSKYIGRVSFPSLRFLRYFPDSSLPF